MNGKREEERRILKARAEALAREPEPERGAGEYLELVEFRLASESYAVESAYVREVYPLKELTPLPCTPAFVLGIINMRGQILSIVDLKKFFDLPAGGLTDLNRVVILHTEDMEFGILADTVIGLRHVSTEEIHPPPPTLKGIQAEYLRGVTKEGLVVLDGGRILTDKRIIVDEEVEAEI